MTAGSTWPWPPTTPGRTASTSGCRTSPTPSEEEFIEMIPFTETRNYVKNILRNYFFYRYYNEKS